jgi:hypothetical protein
MEVKTIYQNLDSNKLNFVFNKMLAKSIVNYMMATTTDVQSLHGVGILISIFLPNTSP